jgi:hypothetical protein
MLVQRGRAAKGLGARLAPPGSRAIRKPFLGPFCGTRASISPSEAVVFSFLGRIVGHLEGSPDRVVFPRNDAANRYESDRLALVAKERHNGAAERSLGRIMPTTMAKA